MENTGLTWRKASKSGNGGDCVQVAYGPDGHATGMVRDSKNLPAGHLTAGTGAFAAFLTSVKRGDLDPGRLETSTAARGGSGRAGLTPSPFVPAFHWSIIAK